MASVGCLMGEVPVIWIEGSRGWACTPGSTGWRGACCPGLSLRQVTCVETGGTGPVAGGRGVRHSQAGGACGHQRTASSMSSGPTEGSLVVLLVFVVIVFNKCLLSSLCYLTLTFGCWYQVELPSPPTCSACPRDQRRPPQLWFMLHTSQDRGFRCPHSSQQSLGSAETRSTQCDPC